MYPIKFFIIVSFIFCLSFSVIPKQNYSLTNGVAELSGKTSFDNWMMESSEMKSTGKFSLINGKLAVVTPFNFSIPVKSFVSANTFRDRSIYKYLKAYPNDKIYFRHVYTDIRPLGKQQYFLKITGNVNIAGVTQIMILNLRCKTYPDSLIKMSGATFMKMSKFQIFPKDLPHGATYNDQVRVYLDMSFKPISK